MYVLDRQLRVDIKVRIQEIDLQIMYNTRLYS